MGYFDPSKKMIESSTLSGFGGYNFKGYINYGTLL
jgi:hypothetical protein